MNRTGSLTVGAALAALALFGLKIALPDIYTEMGDLEKQAVTVLVLGLSQFVWSKLGPKGAK